MDEKKNCCCCDDGHINDCIICGSPLVYLEEEREIECSVCNKTFSTNVLCENGHYVCDECHGSGVAALMPMLLDNTEADPIALFESLMKHPSVHMHGPEHHTIVPCVLLSAYHAAGVDFDLQKYLNEAVKRGRKVPGGVCGFWGVCGAAVGAGIFLSVMLHSNPLNAPVWCEPQKLAADCLKNITALGGPRCCKRTGRIAIETAVEYVNSHFEIKMHCAEVKCDFVALNHECLGDKCKYFG